MASSDATERKLIASLAVNTRWARTPDREAAMEPLRRGMREKFEREVDPDKKLSPAVRAKLAKNAYDAHMKRLALLSVQSRKRAAKAKRKAARR